MRRGGLAGGGGHVLVSCAEQLQNGGDDKRDQFNCFFSDNRVHAKIENEQDIHLATKSAKSEMKM